MLALGVWFIGRSAGSRDRADPPTDEYRTGAVGSLEPAPARPAAANDTGAAEPSAGPVHQGTAHGEPPRRVPASKAERSAPEHTDDPWRDVPVEHGPGPSLGSIESRRSVVEGISSFSKPAFAACFASYRPPADMDAYRLEIELRLLAREADYLIEDAVLVNANISDASVEECVLDIYRGKVVAAVPEQPGRHRMIWPAVNWFKNPT
jgi:hypothetical protein